MRCSFDAGRAWEHTRALCYPRRVGTAGERRAARYLIRQFRALGLRWRWERFPVSHFPTEIGSRLFLALCLALVLLGAGVAGAWPAAAAFCWAMAALLVNAPWRVRHFVSSWPPRTASANILATLPQPGPEGPARVVFAAHYDTKSQLLPTGVRVALVTGTTGLCLLLAVLGLAAAAGLHALLPEARAWRLAGVVTACVLGLLVNVTGNRSPGALDNGSAVGVLLELARCWRPRPEAPVEVVWVATGSEEVELDGARHLLREHSSWWQEKPTLLINLESVGAGARVYLAGETGALRLAREAAADLKLAHATLHVLGAGMDHEPFAAGGLPAVSVLGDVVRKSFALHSRRDDLPQVEQPALERAGLLAAHLAWRWAALHQAGMVPVPETDTPRPAAVVPNTG
jgi:hypothetical protein